MNTAQKVIKYFAYGLACFLAFTIISAIVTAAAAILSVFGILDKGALESRVDCSGYEKCLSLSLGFSELEIKKGEELNATAEDSNVEIVKDGDRLTIKDAKKGIFSRHSNRKITVTIPEDMEFDAVGIGDRGGKITAEKIVAREIDFDLGTGETIFEYLSVADRAKIDTGVGKFEIKDGVIKNGDIHLGIGEANIRAALTGNNKVDAGIGSVNLDLLLPDSAYTIRADKGIGRIIFNGSDMSDDSIIGNGDNSVDVDGGIGQIEIHTAEKPVETQTVETQPAETQQAEKNPEAKPEIDE